MKIIPFTNSSITSRTKVTNLALIAAIDNKQQRFINTASRRGHIRLKLGTELCRRAESSFRRLTCGILALNQSTSSTWVASECSVCLVLNISYDCHPYLILRCVLFHLFNQIDVLFRIYIYMICVLTFYVKW